MALYTTCPGCKRQFQLRAGHLAAASGEVRCGFCKSTFNALDRLDDVPDVPLEELQAAKKAAQKAAAPARKKKKRSATGGVATDNDAVVRTYELQLADLGKAEQKAAASRPFWLAGVFVFSLLLALQSLWHYRNSLYVSYPDLIAPMQKLCAKLPCKAIRQMGLNYIQLVNRDVRFHPQYQDTLLVNATIVNRSDAYMPLPLIEIQVYDLGAEALGWRRFRPEEYMEGDTHLQGMPPDEPIYVILEITGNVATAEGFEIGFAYPQSLLFFAR